jgi:Flp pilus assembly protein TadG
MRTWSGQRGTELVEAALTMPLLLVVAAGLFEFGRACQTWQVLTNAAREGARVAVLPSSSDEAVQARARDYVKDGQLSKYVDAIITVDRSATVMVNGTAVPASEVTVAYPFEFMVLGPVAKLVRGGAGTTAGAPLTLAVSALMRNE